MQENPPDVKTSQADEYSYTVEFLSPEVVEWARANIINGMWSENCRVLLLEAKYYDHLIYELDDHGFDVLEDLEDETDD